MAIGPSPSDVAVSNGQSAERFVDLAHDLLCAAILNGIFKRVNAAWSQERDKAPHRFHPIQEFTFTHSWGAAFHLEGGIEARASTKNNDTHTANDFRGYRAGCGYHGEGLSVGKVILRSG